MRDVEVLNYRSQLVAFVGKEKIMCAKLRLTHSIWDCDKQKDIIEKKEFILKDGYTDQEYEQFLNELNIDAQPVGMYMSGTLWFDGGVWADREFTAHGGVWRWYMRPAIPEELRSTYDKVEVGTTIVYSDENGANYKVGVVVKKDGDNMMVVDADSVPEYFDNLIQGHKVHRSNFVSFVGAKG